MVRSALLVLAAFVAGGVAVLLFARPDPEVIYDLVEVPVERIVEREPDTVVRFVDRIRYVTPDPVQIAVAPLGAATQVASFCAPSVLTAAADTVTDRPPEQLLLRSVVHDPGWWFSKDRLTLTGPTSYGDLQAIDVDVRPGFTVRTVGDSVLVRYPRTGFAREAVEVGGPLLLGLLVGMALGG